MASSIEPDSDQIMEEETSKQLVPSFVRSEIPPLSLNIESSHQMSQKILSKLLAHAGFEGAKSSALNVLTDIMTDYITNIGKTMKRYCDDYSHQMEGDVRCNS